MREVQRQHDAFVKPEYLAQARQQPMYPSIDRLLEQLTNRSDSDLRLIIEQARQLLEKRERPPLPVYTSPQAMSQLRPKGGRLMFGYQLVDGRITTETTAAQTVQQIDALRQQGFSLRGIASMLNEHQVPTGQGGKAWGPSSVREVLAHEPYYRGKDGWPIILSSTSTGTQAGATAQVVEQDAEHSAVAVQVGEHPEGGPLNLAREAALRRDTTADALILQDIRVALRERLNRSIPELIAQIHDPELRKDCQTAYEARRALGEKRGGLAATLITQICNDELRADRKRELRDLRQRDLTRQQAKRQRLGHE